MHTSGGLCPLPLEGKHHLSARALQALDTAGFKTGFGSDSQITDPQMRRTQAGPICNGFTSRTLDHQTHESQLRINMPGSRRARVDETQQDVPMPYSCPQEMQGHQAPRPEKALLACNMDTRVAWKV